MDDITLDDLFGLVRHDGKFDHVRNVRPKVRQVIFDVSSVEYVLRPREALPRPVVPEQTRIGRVAYLCMSSMSDQSLRDHEPYPQGGRVQRRDLDVLETLLYNIMVINTIYPG